MCASGEGTVVDFDDRVLFLYQGLRCMTSIRQAAACMDLVRLGDAFEIGIEMQNIGARCWCRPTDELRVPPRSNR